MTNLQQIRGRYEGGHLEEAWRLYNSDFLSEEEPEFHWYGSLAARRLGKWFAARDAIDRAIALAPVGEVAAKVRFQAGDVCRHIGEYTRAKEELEAALELLSDLPELRTFLLGMVHYNLGLVCEHRSHLSQALHHYRLAQAEFSAERLDNYLRMTLQNVAWVQADLGDPVAAALAHREAQPLCTTEDAIWRQRMLEARIARLQGDLPGAGRLAEWITGAGEGVPPDVRCLTTAIAAEIGVDLGALEPAQLLADMAVALSRHATLDSRCFQIAHRVWQKVKRAALANSGA